MNILLQTVFGAALVAAEKPKQDNYAYKPSAPKTDKEQ